MADDKLTFNDFNPEAYRNRVDIINQTAVQLKKDLSAFGIDFLFSGNETTAYDEFFNQVLKLVEQLIKTDYTKLMQLLYTIDVSEEKVKQQTNNITETFEQVVTRLIIQRELQKVVTRNFFSLKNQERMN